MVRKRRCADGNRSRLRRVFLPRPCDKEGAGDVGTGTLLGIGLAEDAGQPPRSATVFARFEADTTYFELLTEAFA